MINSHSKLNGFFFSKFENCLYFWLSFSNEKESSTIHFVIFRKHAQSNGNENWKMTEYKVRNDDTTTSRQYLIKRKQKRSKKFNKTERKWWSDDCVKVTSILSENKLEKAKSNNNKCVADSYIRLNPLTYILHTYATISNEVNIGESYP